MSRLPVWEADSFSPPVRLTAESIAERDRCRNVNKKFKQALENGECDVVDGMLSEGYIPDPDSIKIVCYRGNVDLLHKLLRFPMDIQEGMKSAVRGNHINVLNHLYLAGGDVNLPSRYGDTLLHCVNKVETCQWLLDMGAKQVPNNSKETPLHLVCGSGNIEIIKLLLTQQDGIDHLSKICSRGESPLHRACYTDDSNVTKVVELLLSYDQVAQSLTQTNKEGCSPLHLACSQSTIETVNLILSYEQGVQSIGIPSLRKVTPLNRACMRDNLQLARLLLSFEQGVQSITKADLRKNTPLHYACINDDYEMAELLLSYKQGKHTINRRNDKKETPLTIAHKEGNEQLEQLLLSYK